MLRQRHSWVLRYSIAVFASFAAVVLTRTLWYYIQPALYPFFLAAVTVSSWFGGLGPGLVSAILGAVLSEYFLLLPIEPSAINWGNLARLSYFTGVAVLICVLNARLQSAQRRAEASVVEAQRNQALLLQHQETLRQREEHYRLLVEGVTDYAIFMLSPEGRILSWTVEAERILGYREAEAIGQPFAILFSQEAIAQGTPERVLAIAQKQGFAKENRWHIRKDGTQFWAQCAVTALKDSAGNLQGFSKIMQDITARKQAEEDRNDLLQREQLARQEAESANRAKDEFLAILSHELRTPLTAITGWIGMLRSGKLNEEKTSLALETIERNATLQMQLVEDLLDISRIIRGDLWLERQPVNLVQVLKDAVEIMQPKIEEKQIQLVLDVSLQNYGQKQQNDSIDRAVANVMGDFDRLHQIVLNLLSNAIKFTPEHGEITISLSIFNSTADSWVNDQSTSNLQLQIKDTGIGIKPDFLPHVFDRFQQADSTSTRFYKGLGLGLAIAKYLVEQQGGTIQAESAGEGQGATFTTTLPLLEAVETQRSTLHLEPSKFSLQNLSILIVEDDADTRIWLTNLFKMQQAQAIAVSSVDEAIVQLNRQLPDVIISDIAMPAKDGYALIQEVRQFENRSGQSIPAIAFTAHASPEEITRSLTAGFDQHLAKPIKADHLITTVVKLLERRNREVNHENFNS